VNKIRFGKLTPVTTRAIGLSQLQRDLDADLEHQIDAMYERMLAADREANVEGAREYYHELARLVRSRSAQQIAKMETRLRLLRLEIP